MNMKKRFLILATLFSCVFFFPVTAQNESGNEPVYAPFEHGWLIDNQTSVVPEKGLIEMIIQHRFGMMDNGFSDLFGIYSPGANIRLALNYSPLNYVQIGYGLTKLNMYSDFSIKWTPLHQTVSGSMPVSVTLYGNMAIDGRNKDQLGIYYDFLNRLSYYSEVIIGRKFNDWFSLQLHAGFVHYNIVAEQHDHDNITSAISGRVKVSSMSSVFFQYNMPWNPASMTENTPDASLPKANAGLGWEISTGYHSFQLYVNSSTGILPQENYMHNTNDFTKGDVMLGFTITRLF